MLGQDRHQPEDQRQLAVVRALKIEAHRVFAQRLGAPHLGVVGAVIRAAFVAQQLPREDHVLARDRMPVGEFRPRIEAEYHVRACCIRLYRLRQQAVERERLVVVAREQAFDDVAADLRECETFDDEWIDAVEGAEYALRQAAALGRLRIGIARVIEAGRQRRLAVHCDAALRRARPRQGMARGEGAQQPEWREVLLRERQAGSDPDHEGDPCGRGEAGRAEPFRDGRGESPEGHNEIGDCAPHHPDSRVVR